MPYPEEWHCTLKTGSRGTALWDPWILTLQNTADLETKCGANVKALRSGRLQTPTSYVGIDSYPGCSLYSQSHVCGLGNQWRMIQTLGNLPPFGKPAGTTWPLTPGFRSVVLWPLWPCQGLNQQREDLSISPSHYLTKKYNKSTKKELCNDWNKTERLSWIFISYSLLHVRLFHLLCTLKINHFNQY